MESYPHENVSLPDTLPILVVEHLHNAGNPGCAFHWHEELEFYYVESGGVLLNCGGEEQWLYPGEIGFVNSFLPHRGMDFLDGTRHCIIQVNPSFFRQELCLPDGRSYESLLLEVLPRLPAFLRGSPALADSFARLTAEWRAREPGWELTAKACMLQIGCCLLRLAPQLPAAAPAPPTGQDSLRHVRELLLYLAEWYPQPEMTGLSALSARFGLSVPYICRIFRRHTGRTVTAYLNELRCAGAAALIRSGCPLAEAGRRVGIEDYNYFSRMFKKTTGFSPGHYRRSR